MDKGTPFTEFVNKMMDKPLSIGLIGVEIGVMNGQNALNLLKYLNIKKLYLVDSFLPYQDRPDKFYTAEELEQEYEKLLKNIEPYSDKVMIIRKSSAWAREFLKDKQLDFVYIDADHHYESVKDDLKWWDLIVQGGIIGGHDYTDAWDFGVIKAVKELAIKVKLSIHELTEPPIRQTEWAIHKTNPKDAKSYISNNSS